MVFEIALEILFMKNKRIKIIFVILLCILLNFGGRALSNGINLPVWLDTMGTCMATYYIGLWAGIGVGIFNNILWGIMFDPITMLYALTSVTVAMAVHICKKKNYMDSYLTALMVSFWVGAICVVISTPLNILFYNGYSGNMWGDALVDMLKWNDIPLILAALLGEMIVELVDKQICMMLAYLIIRLNGNLNKKKIVKTATSVLSVVVLFGALSRSAVPVFADGGREESEDFIATVYNNSKGMMSSEANVIAQTDDGCIWIGSYAGLTKYDGKDFEFIQQSGMTNVTFMLNDSKGRLWIGTNDGGVARYENGEFTFFTVEDGLPENSIRSFMEAYDGSIYVGTTGGICKFTAQDEIIVPDMDITNIISMDVSGKSLICVDNNGNVYHVLDDKIVDSIIKDETGLFVNYVESTSKGLMLGTSDAYLYRLEIDGEELKYSRGSSKTLEDVVGIEEDDCGRIWVCAEAGFGYIGEDGRFREQHYAGFDYSFECVYEDYQGNIWLASSRYGVIKLSTSRFVNLFTKFGVSGTVVNATVSYNDKMYCGTDSGLIILDIKGKKQIHNELTRKLEEVRIRSLMVDSKNNLWISTYGDNGLVRYSESGDIEIFNTESKYATSDRFRSTLELPDGTIVAGTANGINFIKDDSIYAKITSEDGLENPQILTLVCDEDGTVYAGSDGSGIYKIKDEKIIENYNVDNGLTSNVILRMVAYKGGYFIVTSNSLCYMKDEIIAPITEFPYFNNYDIIIDGSKAYVLSSAGVYMVDADTLAEGKVDSYYLIGPGQGLYEGLTANSWNYKDDEYLYLCSNSGIIKIRTMWENDNTIYKYGIDLLECDGKIIHPDDNRYNIPADAKRIVVKASLKNYALTDVKVKFYIEGMETNPEAISYSKLEPIQLTNLTHGTYRIHIQILDNTGGNVLQEEVYELHKEAQVWENGWYKAYLILVCIELIAVFALTVAMMAHVTRRKRELEDLRKELEETVSEQVKEINEQKEKLSATFFDAVVALSEAVDAKDRYTSGHSKRVATYSKIIAQRMGKSEEEQEHIYFAGLLHDVGKIRIPENIINKPGKLTPEEYEQIKIHSVTGYYILKNISSDKDLAIVAKFHHERYDGKGYPNGLKGEAIPELARIVGVADAYDAMTSNRSYRAALKQDVVRQEIVNGRGTQFDPEISDLMIKLIDEDKEYTMKQSEMKDVDILVVDDEDENVDKVKEVFAEELTYHIFSVRTGEEAIELLDQKSIELVLLGVALPTMDGFETLEKIREKSDVPVIFVSNNRDAETIKKATDMGANDYLTKPFLPLALKETIHSVVNSFYS